MEAAQANFEAVLAREPGSGPASFRLSMVLARQGRYLAAADLAEKALTGETNRIEILTHLARCQLMCGRPEKARALALRALSLPRDNALVLDSLGVVLTWLDEQTLAMELFDQALALEKRQALLYFTRGLAQKQFALVEGAERDLETCIAMNPGHAEAHWMLTTLKKQELSSNHIPRLRQQVDQVARSTTQDELVSLSLFKELDDVSDTAAAWPALERGILSRRDRWVAAKYSEMSIAEALIKVCNEELPALSPAAKASNAPVFIFGMPRSGVALLGKLLSRHSQVQHLNFLQPFSRLLSQQLGRDSIRAFDAAAFAQCELVDFEELGRRYIAEVSSPANKQLIICESQPMNFQLAAFIARALPDARMLHVVRDPVDTLVSILGHAGGQPSLPSHDPGKLAAHYLDYHRLMQHWHQVLPGRIMDVSYESLVEKPEMVLRVICAFIGIRYGSALRTGLQLHKRSIGRGHRYLEKLPALATGLAPLVSKSQSR